MGWTILFAIVMFSIIIFVHEFGHFITARMFGVTVHEFAIGMGPKIFSRQKGETTYSLRLIPIGGFCSMEGEDSEKTDDPGSINSKPWYQRLVILSAGSIMNLILGFVITVIFIGVIYAPTGIPTTEVDAVLEQSSLYGELQPGDRIVALNGDRINIRRDLDDLMLENGKNDAVLTVKRDGKKIDFEFTPIDAKRTNGSDAYLVGFTAKVQPMNLFGLLREGYFNTVYNGKLVFKSLKMLISGQAKVSDVSGPVGVVGVMNEQAQSDGILALLFLASFISVNIGIMNLLPLPALDGGRIFFVLIEAVRRKPIPPEKEGVVHFVGIVILLAFMVFVTWNDIMKLIGM